MRDVRRAARARAIRMADITAERTMLEIARLAMADRTAVWRDGKLLPVEDWPADQKALLEGFEVIVKNAAAGDGHTDTVHKVHLARKQGALDLLAKHFRLGDREGGAHCRMSCWRGWMPSKRGTGRKANADRQPQRGKPELHDLVGSYYEDPLGFCHGCVSLGGNRGH